MSQGPKYRSIGHLFQWESEATQGILAEEKSDKNSQNLLIEAAKSLLMTLFEIHSPKWHTKHNLRNLVVHYLLSSAFLVVCYEVVYTMFNDFTFKADLLMLIPLWEKLF